MAYNSKRKYSKRTYGRTTGRKRRPASKRRSSSRTSRVQTIKLVIQTDPNSAPTRDLLGQKPAPGPKTARF